GMFFRHDMCYPLRIKQITDGTSNTFMIGEDVPSVSAWTAWAFANHSSGTCSIPPNSPGVPANPDPAVDNIDWRNSYSFRSKHSGGLFFAFADGSVRFVEQSIDISRYRALATIAGEEAVEAPQ